MTWSERQVAKTELAVVEKTTINAINETTASSSTLVAAKKAAPLDSVVDQVDGPIKMGVEVKVEVLVNEEENTIIDTDAAAMMQNEDTTFVMADLPPPRTASSQCSAVNVSPWFDQHPPLLSPSGQNNNDEEIDDGEAMWKAAGVPIQSMDMSIAKRIRMEQEEQEHKHKHKHKQEHEFEHRNEPKQQLPLPQEYKNGNDGSMMWSAPNSLAPSTAGRMTPGRTATSSWSSSGVSETTTMTRTMTLMSGAEAVTAEEMQVMVDDRIATMMTHHFDGLSKRLGAHLHRVVMDSCMHKVNERLLNVEQGVLNDVRVEMTKSQRKWKATQDRMLLDQTSENQSLQLEIRRRAVKSRARKLVQPDPKEWQLKTLFEAGSRIQKVGSKSMPEIGLGQQQGGSDEETVAAWEHPGSRARTPVV